MSDFEEITTDPRVQAEAAGHPYPLLFATVSGAHLYGFPSSDSDVDLRGVPSMRPALHDLLLRVRLAGV